MVSNIRKLPRRRLFGFFGERRECDGEAADHVECRRDHPAVQGLTNRVADQLRSHVEPQPRRLGNERIDLEPKHAIERNHLLEGATNFWLNATNVASADHIDTP
jgi:hypothetical protein